MTASGKRLLADQNHIIVLFYDERGYRTPGDWTDRPGNRNIEEGLLDTYVTKK